MQFEKSFTVVLVLSMLITFIGMTGFATLISYITIQSNGTIGSSQVVARSGSARDIQNAVNIAAAQGITKVVIPEGTFDFVGVGESWMTVNVPDGISIFGAPTERTSGLAVPEKGMNPNNQVVEWQTILRMPFDAPEGSIWFYAINSNNVRISDLKLVGYREINAANTKHYTGIRLENCRDFRVDHVYFRNMGGGGVLAWNANGVIDHSLFVNNPYSVYATWTSCTVWYGVTISGDDYTWENIADVVGHYTFRTVFIEDCYFEGWRHTTTSNRAAHYVYRYNTERKNGYGTVDGHGGHDGGTWTSTRAMEVYNNDFGERSTETDAHVGGANMGVQLRGGGGVFFNNTVDGYGVATGPEEYSAFVCMIQYTPNDYPAEQIKNVWIWGNQITPVGADLYDVAIGTIAPGSQIRENYEFFLRAPESVLDGFTYTPYQYPHPLVTD